jgi:type II secretory ATPase GspE/PulE/Tfp pilus assembly ATPase PilB-like protein
MSEPFVISSTLMSVPNMREARSVKERAAAIMEKILAARDLNDLFLELRDDLVSLFDVEQLTLYTVDREKRELYSRFILDPLQGVQEIRVAIDETSISGYCARHGKLLNIVDAYDQEELMKISPRLRFNLSWDERSGFRTQQMLVVPILAERKYLMGVLLFLNKRSGGRFSPAEEGFAQDIADTLGVALRSQIKLPQRRGTKFSYLFEKQLLTPRDLEQATTEARRKSTDVETLLVEEYRVPKKAVGEALSRYYGCPFLEFDERTVVDRTLLKGMNLDYLRANYWLPLRCDGEIIEVLLDNPKDLIKVEHIRMLLRGRPLRWVVGLRKDILQCLAHATSKHAELAGIESIIGELTSEDVSVLTDEDDGASSMREDDNAIVRLGHQIIVDAYNRGASDIHIEPYATRQDTVIRLRIDGLCHEYQRIPPTYRRALASRFKVMARLDIAERRKPQDGKIKFRLPSGRDIELRVATLPTVNGDEDIVMRILTASEPLSLPALQMTPRNLEAFERLIRLPYGIILVVGPTGSGKTTTLHAALGAINTPERKIWTAEDPVEITQYGLRQVQVHPRIGFTFAAAMRSFLRADPDVIMVGEMRDAETAHMGIEASLTGHLVFSTLHTNSAPETVTRLLDMGLDPFNFADALLGILAQRLTRTLCGVCKEAYHPERWQYEEVRQAYGPEAFDALNRPYDDTFMLYRGKGCVQCQGTGYKGRMGLHELLVGSEEIRRLIQGRGRVTEIFACAQAEGMTTLLQDGALKVLQGVTDLAQVKAVASK